MKLLFLAALLTFVSGDFIEINDTRIVNIHSIPHKLENKGISYHPSHVFDYSSLPVETKNKFTNCNPNFINFDNSIYNTLSTISKPAFITNLPCVKIFKILKLNPTYALGEVSTLGTLIPELDLKIQPLQSDTEKTEYFCLGINVAHDSKEAKNACNIPNNVLTLYSYSSPVGFSIDLTCPECLVSLQGNVFIHIVIQTTKLAKVKAGFSNATLHTAMVLEFDANEYYNIGLDKILPAVPPTNIFSFSILTIPLNFWFELPVTITGNLAFSAQGQVTYGFRNSYYYNDYSLGWTKDHPTWKMYLKEPKIQKETIFNATANIEVDSFLEIHPSLNFNLDRVFHSSIEATPQLNGNIYWDSTGSQLCTNLTTQTFIDTFAEFDLDINWLGLHDQYKWGPKTIYDSGIIELEGKCQDV